MHLPEGSLTLGVTATTTVAAAAAVIATRFAPCTTLERGHGPKDAWLAAGVFLAQMLNVPTAGGVTVHALGGGILGASVGFRRSVAILWPVLIVQCLLFGDGGLTTLGANIVNMGLIAPAVAALIARRRGPAGAALGASVGVAAAVAACLIELWISGTARSVAAAEGFARAQAPVALFEGAAALVVAAGTVLRPAWRALPRRLAPLAAVAAILAAPLFACGTDALAGFGFDVIPDSRSSPFGGYQVPGVNGSASIWICAVIGVLAAGGLVLLLGRRRRLPAE